MAANPMGSGNGFWKALISASGQRIACTTSNCSGSGQAEHLDWVLKANTTYYRADKTVIGTTDTFFDGSPDKVEPTRDDVDYLLETASACMVLVTGMGRFVQDLLLWSTSRDEPPLY